MRWLFSVVMALFIFSFAAPPVYAIIFLPAIVLIPIAKIIAVIISGFSFPAFGLGVIWSKLFGKSLAKVALVIIASLVLIAVLFAIFLKIHNPERPIF